MSGVNQSKVFVSTVGDYDIFMDSTKDPVLYKALDKDENIYALSNSLEVVLDATAHGTRGVFSTTE